MMIVELYIVHFKQDSIEVWLDPVWAAQAKEGRG